MALFLDQSLPAPREPGPSLRVFRSLGLTAGCEVSTSGVSACGQLPGAIVAEDRLLTAPLTVKDLQGGVVGQTGVVWTVAPDCSFSIARQVGPHIAAPHKHGRLSPEQRQRLGALLARMPATALQGEIGGTAQPNARQIALSYGGSRAVLSLAPRGADPPQQRAAADEPSRLLLDLADALRDMVGS